MAFKKRRIITYCLFEKRKEGPDIEKEIFRNKFSHVATVVPYPLLLCTWFLKNWVWKIQLDELDFLSISNFNFAGYTGSKNQVGNGQKIKFVPLNFSNSIFQKSSSDQYVGGGMDRINLLAQSMGPSI